MGGPSKRLVWVQIDGVGDLSVSRYANKTPLMEAFTPFLDLVARAGANGMCDPVEPGLACGSDTAHLSMFGYDPREFYRGRGCFESLGAGLTMKPGEIAFKCNFATLDEDTGVVNSRRCDRNFEKEGPLLCAFLDGTALPNFPENVVRVKYATEHRCGLVVEGPGLCDRITSTDPLKDNLPLLRAAPTDGTERAARTADVVNEVSDAMRSMLRDHPINLERAREGKSPANCVLLRGCGELLDVEDFRDRHGFGACMVAPTKVIAGIGASVGMEVVEAPGATGDYHTKLTPKVDAIAAALSRQDAKHKMGFLHVKCTDDAGHDGDVDLKRDLIAACDAMVGQLIAKLWAEEQRSEGAVKYFLCCTGDHSTPAEFILDHSHEPVPFALAPVADCVNVAGEPTMRDCVPKEPIELPWAPSESYRESCQALTRIEGFGPSSDAVVRFDEVAAAAGRLGRFPGSQIIPMVASLLE